MTLSYRYATAADIDLVTEMFIEIDVHYYDTAARWRAPAARAAMTAHVRDKVLADGADCHVVLAELDGRAVGLATYAVVYPVPGPSGTLMMKDLYLRPDARGGGHGEAFMRHMAGVAVDKGCSRFDWTAETSNPKALQFYDAIGAPRVYEKVYFRFDAEGLRAFAAGQGTTDHD